MNLCQQISPQAAAEENRVSGREALGQLALLPSSVSLHPGMSPFCVDARKSTCHIKSNVLPLKHTHSHNKCKHTVQSYPCIHVQEHIGEPLFILFRAIKSQLEKAPVDVITEEARNSLSEEKLLKLQLDADVVEGVVDTGTDKPIPIRLLASDTITQAKEKILDALYKNCSSSKRPQLTEVDLELKKCNA